MNELIDTVNEWKWGWLNEWMNEWINTHACLLSADCWEELSPVPDTPAIPH